MSPGSRVPRVRACCDSSYRSVDASPNCELGAQPIPARLATDLDTEHGETDANKRDGAGQVRRLNVAGLQL